MQKESNLLKSVENLDVGFCEADIIASIEEAAQGHIKWIYDCLMARMGSEVSLRMNQSDRQMILKKSTLIYQSYMRAISFKQMK